MDDEFVKEYEQMKKYATDLNDDHLSHTQIHYLYMRSYYPEIKVSKKVTEIMDYYTRQAQKYWVKGSIFKRATFPNSL